MSEFSDDVRAELSGGLRFDARGLRGEVEEGAGGGSRGREELDDPVVAGLAEAEGVRLGPSATISRLELVGSGLRGGGAHGDDDGVITVDLPPAERGERQAVLVEEDGAYAWFIPERRGRTVDLPLEAAPGTRGIGSLVNKAIRVIAVKTVGKAVGKLAETAVGAIDGRRNPYHIRTWSPDDYREKDAPEADFGMLSGKEPSLLVVHGFMGSISTSFHDFDPDVVAAIHRAYGGRTFAFGHPTIAMSPHENAKWFLDNLPSGTRLELDILAHSRGGLVARELAQVIQSRKVNVRRIVFVATPNAGTPLADTERPQGLLDAMTNLLSAIPGTETIALAAGLLQDILFDNVLSELDGITAMHPSGKYLATLNGLPTNRVQMRSISAEFEPRTDAGIVKTNLDRLVDAYFGGLRNDRVVPTIATHVTEGEFNIPAGHRLVLDSSRSVHHSSFWDNERVVDQFERWLRPEWDDAPVPTAETDPRAEVALPPDPITVAAVGKAVAKLSETALTAVEDLVGGPIDQAAKPPRGTGDAVVVLPGIMGSYLRSVDLGSLIWVNPRGLNRGHFDRLALGKGVDSDEIETAGVHRTYLPLVSKLSATRDVFVADFDWRIDIEGSAKRLAELIKTEVLEPDPDRTVHIVAHSMGGLVARALAVVDNDLWRRAVVDRGGRLVMLGTPNRGSYSIPLTLSGQEAVLKVLAAADFANRRQDLVDVVATFPGVYQMLPAPGFGPDDDHLDLYRPATWGPTSPVQKGLLDRAKRFHDRLTEVRDPERLVYVAGYGSDTPYRLEVREPGQFSIGRFKAGDGRVAHALGLLDGVTTFYSPAGHGALVGDPDVLGAIDKLLDSGHTDALETEPPARRAGETDPEHPRMLPADEFDPGPVTLGPTRGGGPRNRTGSFEHEVDRALGAYLGGSPVAPSRPRLTVKVVHASLEKANYAVAVGHYKGVPPEGAEGFLDHKLGRALSRREESGLYPEDAGTASYIDAPHGLNPAGAIVLGLGEFGSLTPRNLSDAMTEGALAAALRAHDAAEDPDGLEVGVAAVLVGSPGRYGVTLPESVFALTEGVARATLELRRLGLSAAVTELELIELYELTADDAAMALRDAHRELPSEITAEVDIEVAERVEVRSGGRTGGSPSIESGAPWVRMIVEFDEANDDETSQIRTIELSRLERGAQANRLSHQINLPKITRYAGEAARRSDLGSDVARTLYELLFPHRTKLELDRSENLHLVLTQDLAQIPWELVADRDASGDVRPLSLRAGMLRQLLADEESRDRPLRPTRTNALVIGDPPTDLPRLPGAREEARRVANILRERRYEVTERVYEANHAAPAWMEIQNALLAEPYRIVHIAAHGIYDEADEGIRSGVVIGPEDHHRLSTLDFRQMSTTPDLVFLNACHLGRLGSLFTQAEADDDEEEMARLTNAHARPAAMAASVARQLMHNGVKAVVVAGWAVDDLAAYRFAERLYRKLLAGERYGDAVTSAREAARVADDGRSNTWGAYQCYGDPDFRLPGDQAGSRDDEAPVSSTQLTRWIENLGAAASDLATGEHRRRHAERIEVTIATAGATADDPRVQQALGIAYGDLGDYEHAVEALRNCLMSPDGIGRLESVEQLANFEVRRAVELCRSGAKTARSREVVDLLQESYNRLTSLIGQFGGTPERFALLGSFHKKRAAITDGKRTADRESDIELARDQYHEAWKQSSKGRDEQDAYHTLAWLQMASLSSGRLSAEARDALARIRVQIENSAARTDLDYWTIAATADLALTDVVISRTDRRENVERARDAYIGAFNLRSSVRQRDSAMDHIDDLAALAGGDLAKALTDLGDSLRSWKP